MLLQRGPAAIGSPMGKRQKIEETLAGLNPRQCEAVLHGTGPLLVLAGAGSGKTRVITVRIAKLLDDGVAPDRILGVTFTNKAANEMRKRLAAMVGKTAGKVHLSTFHALGLTILKEEYAHAALRPGFCIYDTGDQLSLVRDLMRHTKVADRRLDPGRVLDLILKAKRARQREVEIDWGDEYEFAAHELYGKYVEQMRAYNAIDFDDLLLRSRDVLRIDTVRERWQQRFEHVLVDEYQDTSADQLELIQILVAGHHNVCVVGDDDQSIYGWRGAAADSILAFGQQFRGTREVILDQNYRSTNAILNAANAVIRNNKVRKVKQLWSASGAGDPVEVVECVDGDDEALFVTETMHRLIYDGVPARDIAVLYRTNTQSRIFEETLAMERIPFKVVGGQAFFERKEVRDALAFLGVASNPHDELALRRVINVPPRGIGPASLDRLVAHGESSRTGLWGALCAADHVHGLPRAAVEGAREFVQHMQPLAERLRAARAGSVAPVARELFEQFRLRDAVLAADDAPTIAERRLDNLEEVLGALARFESNAPTEAQPLAEFLRFSSLVRGPSEDEENPVDHVTLMTLHSAKGLEFPYVFLVGMEEEVLPHKKTLEQGGELSEERRLCYVGITRARRRLWATWARHRQRHGKMVDVTPSRFLQEMPEGDGIHRWRRAETKPAVSNEDMGNAFFKRMFEELGIKE